MNRSAIDARLRRLELVHDRQPENCEPLILEPGPDGVPIDTGIRIERRGSERREYGIRIERRGSERREYVEPVY
jgi:hypothetical protein